ncbi:hydroxymethylglutaryl-CoA lyase [Sphingomonas colocasiae]|uniref:Hydroxymethylglutaryl-CoA lyase n=1 Tax=Sphingomonas colocasiae TaxID=1848973 RepID=A0ABS7PLE9_9SPHN|nr:hydroxymethylglutaryl-CoA lyase [Sphingomonas colocasiae]MBY8822073.1 hydroxymethylglutaryl-CoA lyase [Sphingomonas colocasiae]
MTERTLEIVEVSARDGLQNESVLVSTADKVALITRMIDAGARRFEVGSFVNPKRVPQMADTPEVIAALPDREDVRYIGLCLNRKGVERAARSRDGNKRGVDEAGCVTVASDAFGIANQGQNSAESVAENRAMLALARQEGLVPQVTIATAFGCPFEKAVSPDRVVEIAERLAEADPVEIAVADTIGVAVPGQVRDLIGRLRELLPAHIRLRAHFHDTRATGVANAWAAWEAGADVLDSSLGGLGGCPFAPGATGNVATEDLAYLFGRSGVDTGIDLDKAIAVNRWFAGVMGKPLPSNVGRAGGF